MTNPPVQPMKKINAVFFRTAAGGEPVRDWLKAMSAEDRKIIGDDIRTAEFGWPVGMPICRPMGQGLFEVRSSLPGGRIGRVFFYVDAAGNMVLLHAIIKKSQKTPAADLELARRNKATHEAAWRR
ncbi:phage-related protein [Azospirillum fermentarium]|uniref:type II toxin-antitoxin system RelE/ParE family toxin n=1 Tax=Azospirillum fermentarium TaxID=1233114 RepID=UPI0022274F68|nr:type II toxin-antitoxin system RelE/ParE family toxin [Azospirillum fermentarium]MCW2244757.1 phage-related protein [Azospirillum fermentarium]